MRAVCAFIHCVCVGIEVLVMSLVFTVWKSLLRVGIERADIWPWNIDYLNNFQLNDTKNKKIVLQVVQISLYLCTSVCRTHIWRNFLAVKCLNLIYRSEAALQFWPYEAVQEKGLNWVPFTFSSNFLQLSHCQFIELSSTMSCLLSMIIRIDYWPSRGFQGKKHKNN